MNHIDPLSYIEDEDRQKYDPALRPLAYADINDERVLCYPHAFFAVVQKDGTFEAARMD